MSFIIKNYKNGDTLYASDLNNLVSGISEANAALDQKVNSDDVYTKSEIDAKLSSVYSYKGSVATYDDLPETAESGDVYNVEDTGDNYAWDGSKWDKLAGTIDLSGYLTIAVAESTYATVQALQDGLNSKQAAGNYATVDQLNNYATIDSLSQFVKYTNYGTTEDPRNTIELKNYDSISGLATTGTGYNLAMVSKWDVADFGSTGLHSNLNTKDNITINDTDVIATTTDVADSTSNIDIIKAQLQILQNQVQQIKAASTEPVEISADSAAVSEPDKDVSFAGSVDAVVASITAKSIQSTDASINNGRLSAKATGDAAFTGLSTTGDLPKSTANAGLSVDAEDYVAITSSNWNQTGYNAIEVGLNSVPKAILIDSIDFASAMSNNAISIFAWQSNATITISNCHFSSVSNPLRISNRNNLPATINIINCTVDKWEDRWDDGQYAGFICMQDYTSGSAQAAQEANQFDKLIINFINCTAPDGTRITGNAQELFNKHQIYVYNEWEGLIDFGNGSRFPQVTAQ